MLMLICHIHFGDIACVLSIELTFDWFCLTFHCCNGPKYFVYHSNVCCLCFSNVFQWCPSFRKYQSSPVFTQSLQGWFCSMAPQVSGPTQNCWTTSCSGWDCWQPSAPKQPKPPSESWSLHHTTLRWKNPPNVSLHLVINLWFSLYSVWIF